jgi:hypothetical protein
MKSLRSQPSSQSSRGPGRLSKIAANRVAAPVPYWLSDSTRRPCAIRWPSRPVKCSNAQSYTRSGSGVAADAETDSCVCEVAVVIARSA